MIIPLREWKSKPQSGRRDLYRTHIQIYIKNFYKSIRKRQFDKKNWIEGVNKNFTKEVNKHMKRCSTLLVIFVVVA